MGAYFSPAEVIPSLDLSRLAGIAESITKKTVQMVNVFVVQFMCSLTRRLIALRELEIALRAHTRRYGALAIALCALCAHPMSIIYSSFRVLHDQTSVCI